MILERSGNAFGHIHSIQRDGFTWDQGPHVSFTKHQYVRDLFADGVNGEFEEHKVKTSNYFKGAWISHPAQSNLYQVPEPLRSACVESFLKTRPNDGETLSEPRNYQEWLEQSFGKVFANTFSAAYTRKYWTCEPKAMTTDWVGGRVFQPKVEDITRGAEGPLDRQTHYITKVRYPSRGGYQSFASKLSAGANIQFGKEVVRISLAEKKLWAADGSEYSWSRLINTLPLPLFVALCADLDQEAQEAARALVCSQLLLVNIAADHPTIREENWMYVYDEDMYSTRINCTEKLSPNNAPLGTTGVQVEVYGSRFKHFKQSPDEIVKAVVSESKRMGLIKPDSKNHAHSVFAPWANVIFTQETAPALALMWKKLENFGLKREEEDSLPLTDWTKATKNLGAIVMAGRFGQWKYFWTDDCVLRGQQLEKDK